MILLKYTVQVYYQKKQWINKKQVTTYAIYYGSVENMGYPNWGGMIFQVLWYFRYSFIILMTINHLFIEKWSKNKPNYAKLSHRIACLEKKESRRGALHSRIDNLEIYYYGLHFMLTTPIGYRVILSYKCKH